jgi:hypothetical protein
LPYFSLFLVLGRHQALALGRWEGRAVLVCVVCSPHLPSGKPQFKCGTEGMSQALQSASIYILSWVSFAALSEQVYHGAGQS